MRAKHRKARSGRAHRMEAHQKPPPGDWDIWLLLGGRGSGKTEAGANAVIDHLRDTPGARVGIGASTVSDARDVCAEGDTGLITLFGEELNYNRSLSEARHRRGGYVKFLGSEKPARWNGPQWSMLWVDELALWSRKKEDGGTSWDHALFGLRLGFHPRAIITTTPKNRKFLKEMKSDPKVAVTIATTYDNPHLSALVRQRLEERYGGTRLGRQELLAEFIDDAEGALWQRVWIEERRVKKAPDLSRIIVAVDPSGGAEEDDDEQGIIVCGAGNCHCKGDAARHIFVMEDLSGHFTPNQWARRTVAAYKWHKADRIVAEVNFGGDMVRANLRTVDKTISFKAVRASRGKQVRAEPVAALYEPKQGVVHHVGVMPDLEDQLCSWVPGEGKSPDRLDALVWGVNELYFTGTRKPLREPVQVYGNY